MLVLEEMTGLDRPELRQIVQTEKGRGIGMADRIIQDFVAGLQDLHSPSN